MFLGPMLFVFFVLFCFLQEANEYYILFWGYMMRRKMVVVSPGIVADISYDVIVKNLI